MIGRNHLVSVLLCCLTIATNVSATQVCNSEVGQATTPTSRFADNGDGTVTDSKTGLMWAKCTEGRSGNGCATGTWVTYTWAGALNLADGKSLAGSFDWRLPNIKELHSIIEEQCMSPAINLAVFPNTPNGDYWSSTPDWYVGFDIGEAGRYGRWAGKYVRLVRSGPKAADVTPPETVAGPSVSGTTATGTILAATINENGTGYYLVQAAAVGPPTIEAVVAANSFGMSENVQTTVNISGLTASTAYKIYFVAKDTSGNSQTAVQEVAFTTRYDTPPATGALNDTGITWGGNSPDGNNSDCSSNIAGAQDCSQGRDATHNDDSDGHAGFSYTKLDANGNSLPASATSWSCVSDNVTGLVWEVKTDDGTIHDKDKTYSWGGPQSLVSGSNNAGFCGYTDWRVPTVKELMGLVNYGRNSPAVDIDYFPNTQSNVFWSASPVFPVSMWNNYSWQVNFHSGGASHSNRSNYRYVRLVRSGQ